MTSAADYRRQAETCLSLALSATDPVIADKLRTMACELIDKSVHADEEPKADLPPFVTNLTDGPIGPSKP